ncbi:pectinesterase inhibitor 10-like [Ctenocephalides felis]|uniref:pectinesterase inhibitor 10-like n=1 Tax=Ctenocephalides felis TaxID=7515 RepID=UPI000E6E2267|nr:pectinesterase inhibitor 10-like [Ctenocephalides felis]
MSLSPQHSTLTSPPCMSLSPQPSTSSTSPPYMALSPQHSPLTSLPYVSLSPPPATSSISTPYMSLSPQPSTSSTSAPYMFLSSQPGTPSTHFPINPSSTSNSPLSSKENFTGTPSRASRIRCPFPDCSSIFSRYISLHGHIESHHMVAIDYKESVNQLMRPLLLLPNLSAASNGKKVPHLCAIQ